MYQPFNIQFVRMYKDSYLPRKPKDKTDSGFDVGVYDLKKLYVPKFKEFFEGENPSEEVQEFDSETGSLKNNRVVIPPFGRALFGTGIKVMSTIDDEYICETLEWQSRSRSGLAATQGLIVLNAPGTIDHNYCGEILVNLYNSSFAYRTINFHDRVAQIVPCPVYLPHKINVITEGDVNIDPVNLISNTKRGIDGHGSTGVNQ